jgi:hypothetical protein
MEDRRFRELFGASIGVVLHVWHAMEEGGLLPNKSKPKHLLWTLYFLKVYPREAPGCSAVGGGGGDINPKTLRKWVWLFIERIAELADDVVSNFIVVARRNHRLLTPPARRRRRTDRIREQVGRPRRGQRLTHFDRWDRLQDPPEGSRDEGECLCIAQIRDEVRTPL